MGTAFAGLADDPSAIMHNPAGLTQVKGTNIYSGVTALIPSSEYTSPSGASEETDFNVFFPPHFYICSDFDLESLTNPSRARPWHLTFEAEWLNWSRFDHQTLDFEHEVPGAGFSDMVIDFDWKDQWFIKFGLEYYLNKTFAIRTGYAFIKTQVPNQTLSPAYPDADAHNFSIGFGYKINKWTLDGFFMVEIYKDREVNNDILNGEYKNSAHFIGFSLGYRF